MFHRSLAFLCATTIALSLGVAPAAEAQLGGLVRRATRSAEDKLANEIDRLMREGVRCVFYDAECIQQAESDGKTPVMTDSSGNLLTDAATLCSQASAGISFGAGGRPV